MKVAHEAPIGLLETVRNNTDYDYALVHLFEKYPEYYQFFEDSLDKNRTVILDNSLYELGTSFDNEKFLYWVNKLQPTYYIIPDAFNDKNTTINNVKIWEKYKYEGKINIFSKSIAVLQGNSNKELFEIFEIFNMTDYIDMIAVSFGYDHFKKGSCLTVSRNMIKNRLNFIKELYNKYDKHKKLHLLGCISPLEYVKGINMFHYNEMFTTCDTSFPITYTLDNDMDKTKYLENKSNIKIADIIDYKITDHIKDECIQNIKYFRENILRSKNVKGV